MSTRKLQLPISGFPYGLNTEASVLNVLPSEFMDGTVNVELLSNASARRRRGVDFLGESDAGGFLQTIRASTKSAETKQESPSAIFVRLTAPSGDVIERVVVNIDNEFQIFEPTSTGLANIDTPYQTITRTSNSASNQKFFNMQFAQSGNKLFFAGRHCQPGYLSVDADNVSLKVTYINVLIRNPNATAINDRVSRNGSWFDCIESHTSSTTNRPDDGTGDWERYWMRLDGAIPSGITAWATSTSYDSTFVKQYNKDSVPTNTDTFPTTVSFFGGRVWLAGDPKNPNDIYFSQVVANDSDLEKFHQFADPFDPNDPDLVDDDGGVISLQGATKVERLLSTASSIFVGSNAGIWQITGPDNIFKATNFSNSLVLADGIEGPGNMVAADDEFVVFARNGIWRSDIKGLTALSTTGNVTFKSLSQDRVDTLYNRIPQANKASATAIYNSSDQRIYYFVNENRTTFDSSYNSSNQPGYYTNILILATKFNEAETSVIPQQEQLKRTVKEAFFLYEFDNGGTEGKPYISAPFICKPSATDEVIASGVDVQASAVDVISAGSSQASNVVLFLALQRVTSGSTVTIKGAFGTMSTSVLRDWDSDATYAVTYESPMYLGVQTMGDIGAKKVATYLYFVFKKVESGTLDDNGVDTSPGGCFLRTAWQFSTSTTSNKFSDQQQIYVPDRFSYAVAGAGSNGHDHTWYKHRVRGRGNALQIIIEEDGNKDYHLIGFTQQFYGKPL